MLPGTRMRESQCLCMQGMAGNDLKTVFDELFVLCKYGSFHNTVASIGIIIKEGVAGMLHMYPDLVRTAGFQPAGDQRYVVKTFEYFIVGDGFLAVFSVGVGVHDLAEALVAAHMGYDGAFVFLKIAPNQGQVLPLYGMVKELFSQVGHGFI